MAQDFSDTVWPGWNVAGIIGHESYGKVYAIERDVFGHTEKAALKVISIPQNDGEIEELYNDGYDSESIAQRFKSHLQDIVREYSLMSGMKGHSNIVYCEDLRCVQHDDGMGWDIYIKMELLTPLPKILKNGFSEKLVIKLGLDICNALILCKSKNIVHRDIKPQNIFVSEDKNFKLGDFGIAKIAERTTSGTKTGTYKYIAPEVYNNQPYGHAADIYSLGMVLYWLLNERRTPFLPLPPKTPTATDEEYARDSRFAGLPIPEPVHGSNELKRIVLKACAFSPEERYKNAAEMRNDLLTLARNGSYTAQNPRMKRPIAKESPMRAPVPDTDETVGNFRRAQKEKTPTEETVGVFSHNAVGSNSNKGTNHSNYVTNENNKRRKEKKRHFGGVLIVIALALALLSVCFAALFFVFEKKANEPLTANIQTADSMGFTYEIEPDFWIDVCYHCNGGHGGPDGQRCAVYNQELTFVHPSNIPQREGYTFTGWLYGNSNAYNIEVPGETVSWGEMYYASPLDYYAQWTQNSASSEKMETDIISNGVVGIAMPSIRQEQEGKMLKSQLETLEYQVDLRYADNDISTQVSQVENMIANGCQVLVISSIDVDSLGTVLEQAKEKGIPVIAYDRLIMGSDAVSYYATFDNWAVGVKQGEYIVKALDLENAGNKTYNIEYITGDPGDNNINFFFDGAISVLQPYIDNGTLVCPSGQTEKQIVSTPNWDTDEAQKRFETILDTYYTDGTNLDAVLASNDSTALGVANALESSYTGSYPVLTGQNCDIASVKNMIAGKQSMSVFKDPRDLTAKTVEMVDAMMKGIEPPYNDTTIYDNGTGVITSYLCEPVVGTKDNVQELLIDSGYYTADQLAN